MKHLKLFFALFAMLALGVGNAWGAEETVTFTNKDWSPWTKITSGSSFESSNSKRGVANNGVNGSCKSSTSYTNITKISYVASSNTTGGKVTIKVGNTTVGESSITKDNNKTYSYDVDNLSGVITLSVTKPSSKTVWVKSITIVTSDEDEPGNEETVASLLQKNTIFEVLSSAYLRGIFCVSSAHFLLRKLPCQTFAYHSITISHIKPFPKHLPHPTQVPPPTGWYRGGNDGSKAPLILR